MKKSRNSHGHGLRVVAGVHAVREALRIHASHIKVLELRENHLDNKELVEVAEFAKKKSVPMRNVPRAQLDKQTQSHQGVIAYLTMQLEVNWSELEKKESSVVFVLDGIEDPHNLGAILRTSWLMGVDAIFVKATRAIGLTATVSKVACGGAEYVPVEVETDFPQLLKRLKDSGYWVYGLSGEAEKSLWEEEFADKVAWVVGSEASGLSRSTEKLCDIILKIPQTTSLASYNASVAAALAVGSTASYRIKIKNKI